MYTASGHEVAAEELPRAGYCQYCGAEGAHVEPFRPESSSWQSGKFTFRTRAYYVCGRDHFDAAVREEVRAEVLEQFEAHQGASVTLRTEVEQLRNLAGLDVAAGDAERRLEWKVTDRYCWLCGEHGALFKSTTRCRKCGELQRLYIRDRKAETTVRESE